MATAVNGNDNFSGLMNEQSGAMLNHSVPYAQSTAQVPGLKVLEADIDLTGLAAGGGETAINLGQLPRGSLILACSAKGMSTLVGSGCQFSVKMEATATSVAGLIILGISHVDDWDAADTVANAIVNGRSQQGTGAATANLPGGGEAVFVEPIAGTDEFVNLVHTVTVADVVGIVKIKVLYFDPF